MRRTATADDTTMNANDPSPAFNFAYLDERTKRMIRRTVLKAVAIPGYQVPFGSREMPLPYGWGTGGIQVTAAVIGPDEVLKVIDQGSDDTVNAVNIRRFFERTAGVQTTTQHRRGHPDPDPPPHSGNAAARGANHRLPGAGAGAACSTLSRARPKPARCMRWPSTG